MGWKLSPRNIIAAVAAPFTYGASLALAKDNDGNTGLDHLTGAASAKKANEQNIALQQATNKMSIDLANTAHQREVADLEAAGLNPILSAGGTGAATPTLGTAQVQNTMPGGLATTAMQVGQAAQLFGQAKQAFAQAKISNIQANKQEELLNSEIEKNRADASLSATNALNAGTKTTAMKNDEEFQKTWWGRNISPALRDIFGTGSGQAVANSATSARNANKMANAIKNTPHTHVHYH